MRDETETPYSIIYQVLDDLQTLDTVPSATRGKLYFALDSLRASKAPAAHIATAERISVAMHRQDLARRKRDKAAEQWVRDELATLNADWLETRLPKPTMMGF